MVRQTVWRKALLLSCLIHLLLFGMVGFWSGKLLFNPQAPQTIELELIDVPTTGDKPERKPSPPAAENPQAAKVVIRQVAKSPEHTVDPKAVADDVFPSQPGMSAAGSGEKNKSAGSAAPGAIGRQAAKGVTGPRVLSRVEPRYPEEARQSGVEGSVVVKAEILETGHPGEVSIVSSSGSKLLDDAAVQAVREWRFIPAHETDSRQAIRCFSKIAVVFKLR
ncbi:TonB family protein [Anaeroselena agilis]|uniref:Energy transducer TonB n=1 Tax=Anaeroselena agilis TaxID=3063788 RepID=A0ABU3P394_9FIRM|nr:energy transducer TonB [Selenomonadales bacterium 4137-cl]